MNQKELFGITGDVNFEYFFIKANSAGLRKFADNLNRIAADMDENPTINEFNLNAGWTHNDIHFEQVERANDITEFDLPEPIKQTLLGDITRFGCLIFGIILSVAIGYGLFHGIKGIIFK